MIRIWCEWDMGQEHRIFTTEEKAREWLVKNWPEDVDYSCWQEAWADGDIGFEYLIIDS